MLTPADAARLAKISRDTIYREIERGSLRALHVGGRLLRIDPTDLRRWLEGEPNEACSWPCSCSATDRQLPMRGRGGRRYERTEPTTAG
jgi:excisionase family DNA binding protein